MALVKTPSPLREGSKIGLVCPAGYMDAEKVSNCIHTLGSWGFETVLGNTVGGPSQNYFSGSDEERLEDFQAMLDNPEIEAILAARGGYGMSRIIDRINFKKFRKKPKWIIGYSDITVLHYHIYSNYRIATLHAPMAAAFNVDDISENIYLNSLKETLRGKKIRYKIPADPDNRKGQAIGALVGGNLALLAHLCGTSSDIDTKDKILFIEDTGEYLYNVDRMMYQLKRSGKFEQLAGLILGGFSEMKDTTRPFGKSLREIFLDLLKEYNFPVCFNFPVSHENENFALKIGVGYKLKVGKNTVSLEE